MAIKFLHCVVSWISHWHPWTTAHSEGSQAAFCPPKNLRISCSLTVSILIESSQFPESGYRSWISCEQSSEVADIQAHGCWTQRWGCCENKMGGHQMEKYCFASESYLWFRWLENLSSGVQTCCHWKDASLSFVQLLQILMLLPSQVVWNTFCGA